MPRLIKTSWTSDQVARMKELADAGASALRISAALKRPVTGIKVKARELGIAIRTDREIRNKM